MPLKIPFLSSNKPDAQSRDKGVQPKAPAKGKPAPAAAPLKIPFHSNNKPSAQPQGKGAPPKPPAKGKPAPPAYMPVKIPFFSNNKSSAQPQGKGAPPKPPVKGKPAPPAYMPVKIPFFSNNKSSAQPQSKGAPPKPPVKGKPAPPAYMPVKIPFHSNNKSSAQPQGKGAPSKPPAKGKPAFALIPFLSSKLKIPFLSSDKPDEQPQGRGEPSKLPVRGKPMPPPPPPAWKKGKAAPPPPPKPARPILSWWEALSPDRKIDVIGAGMAVMGLFIILILVSGQHSPITEQFTILLLQILGWGIYALALGMIFMGLWLILRWIEKMPQITLERITGIVLLFLWLLGVMHSSIADPPVAYQAALDGVGGGYIGSLIEQALFNNFGEGGAWVAFFAWLVIAITMVFDLSVEALFRWINLLIAKLRAMVIAPNPQTDQAMEPANAKAPPPNRPEPVVRPSGAVIRPAGAVVRPGGVVAAPVKTVQAPPAAVIEWKLPDITTILEKGSATVVNEEFIEQRSRLIQETLASFGAPVQVVEINRGPTITQFGAEPLYVETRSGRMKVRVNKIASLADDLALALSAPRIRIQAPVPGHSYVGIEVPNEEMTMVALRDLMESESFQRNKNPLRFALGKDVIGNTIGTTLENMPHLLIAGTTGSGKSVCVNAILTCFLLNNTPDDLRLILVDPKRVELTNYNGVPHLLSPVIVEIDRVIGALQWVAREMDKRYHQFAQMGSRNITDYNAKMKAQGGKKLPFLVIVIDELADLMMIAPGESEAMITRLAQLARATGIHMILATQRPSVDVVTGLIKANFPARVAFAVASNTDSRVILDQPGAERLLGRGDMLFQAPDAPAAARLQGVFVSDHEIQKLVDYWRAQAGGVIPAYAAPGAPSAAGFHNPKMNAPLKQTPLFEDMTPVDTKTDPLLPEAIDLVRKEGRASVSMLQRRMRIGYTRAARIVDMMEDKKIVGPPEGTSQMRQVLDYGPTIPPRDDGA